MKFITKILRAAGFALSLFLLLGSMGNLLDVVNSAKLMGWGDFIPTIIAQLIFISMLLAEGWLSLRIAKLDDRATFFALSALLLLTAGELVAPVSLGASLLWLNLLQLLLILLARFAIDFRQ